MVLLGEEIANRLEENTSTLADYGSGYFKQEEFHRSLKKNRWFIGGNRTGKTTAGAAEAVWFATGWHPYRKVKVPNSGWIVSLDFPNSRDVAQPKLFELLPEWMIDTWNKSECILTLINGSKIGFKSCDSGRKKFQGADKEWVWFDEEPDEEVFKECITRIKAGSELQIWGTMTPLEGISWTYTDIYKSSKESIFVVTATIYDNPFLPRDEITELESSYNEYDKEARLLGKYVVMAGSPVFSPVNLKAYYDVSESCKIQGNIKYDRKLKKHYMDEGVFRAKARIWIPPINREPYVIGADVSEGEKDACSAHVMNRKGQIVADWHGRLTADVFGEELVRLGRYYNNALVAPEKNEMGHVTIDHMRMLKYPNIYKYKVSKKATDVHNKLVTQTKLGWLTNSKTRPLMIAYLARLIRGMNIDNIPRETVEELMTFVVTKDGDMKGQGFDDRVMSLAITCMLWKVMPRKLHAPVKQEYQPNSSFTGY